MGWRISLYSISKTTAEKYRHFTQEDYDAFDEEMFDELEKEKIKYDTLTDIICSDNSNKFSSKFFDNRLDIEDDMYFGTISKEQFINIIEEVRIHIVNWFNNRRVILKDNEEPELGELWSDKEGFYLGQIKADEAMKKNQNEWNHKGRVWQDKWQDKDENNPNIIYHHPYLNLDLSNKWLVSDGWTYEYLIFDLIHILKIFDWENDVLLCIGG